MCGARVRGRDAEEERKTAMERWSERGVQSRRDRCRVLVPTMPVRPRRDTLEQHEEASSVGLDPEWLEFGEGLTPLLRDDLVQDATKRCGSKACLRASM